MFDLAKEVLRLSIKYD